MSLQSLDPKTFFQTGVDTLNNNFSYLQSVATQDPTTLVNSGLCSPVLMTQGSDNQHWNLPASLTGPYVVLDQGRFLRKDEYNEIAGQVVLNYTPLQSDGLYVSWCLGRGGVTRPVLLTQGVDTQHWDLPSNYSSNVWVYDKGNLLLRSQYYVDVITNQVVLSYIPQNGTSGSPEISASWGTEGPGMTPLKPLAQSSGSSTVYIIPKNASSTFFPCDHGHPIASTFYTLDWTAMTMTLGYNPSDPSQIAASWGYDMDGLFFDNISTLETPDGALTSFTLTQEPIDSTVQLYRVNSDLTRTYLDLYVDFTLEGRTLTMTSAPSAGSSLVASMMTTVFTPAQGTMTLTGSVKQDSTIQIDTDQLDEEYVFTPGGLLNKVIFRDNGSIMLTKTWTYNTDGTVATRVDTGSGKTITHTYSYDGSGNLTGVTKTVV